MATACLAHQFQYTGLVSSSETCWFSFGTDSVETILQLCKGVRLHCSRKCFVLALPQSVVHYIEASDRCRLRLYVILNNATLLILCVHLSVHRMTRLNTVKYDSTSVFGISIPVYLLTFEFADYGFLRRKSVQSSILNLFDGESERLVINAHPNSYKNQ